MTSRHAPARASRMVTGSPLGPLTLVASNGALIGLYMDHRAAAPADTAVGTADPSEAGTGAGWPEAGGAADRLPDGDAVVLAETARQLDEYFAGRRRSFDLPVELAGTPFQRRVWEALRGIGYGETVSYGQLADNIGQPTASRAVGLANGRNPVSIIVPCHRVIGADGSLTGYGGGIANKERLLALERRVAQSSAG